MHSSNGCFGCRVFVSVFVQDERVLWDLVLLRFTFTIHTRAHCVSLRDVLVLVQMSFCCVRMPCVNGCVFRFLLRPGSLIRGAFERCWSAVACDAIIRFAFVDAFNLNSDYRLGRLCLVSACECDEHSSTVVKLARWKREQQLIRLSLSS